MCKEKGYNSMGGVIPVFYREFRGNTESVFCWTFEQRLSYSWVPIFCWDLTLGFFGSWVPREVDLLVEDVWPVVLGFKCVCRCE